MAEVTPSGAERRPEMATGRRVPRREGMQGENLGTVVAGLIAKPREPGRRTVLQIGPGEGGHQARLPGSGAQLRAGAQRLAGSGVVEAAALSRQRGDVDRRGHRERTRRPGRPGADAVPNGGVGDVGGAPRVHGGERGVDGVGDTLRAGSAGRGRGAVGTPVLARIVIPVRVIAHAELDVDEVVGLTRGGSGRVPGTNPAAGIELDIQADRVIGIARVDARLGADQVAVGAGRAEDRSRGRVHVRECARVRVEIQESVGGKVNRGVGDILVCSAAQRMGQDRDRCACAGTG